MKILINIFFTLKGSRKAIVYDVALLKEQCKLDIRKYSSSQWTINEWNKLSTDCVNASRECLKIKLTNIS